MDSGSAGLALANQLIEQLTAERLDPGRYEDEFRRDVLELVEKKVAGEEVVIAPQTGAHAAGEARQAFERALALDPDFADAHFNLAGLCEQLGRKPDALRHYRAYKKLT